MMTKPLFNSCRALLSRIFVALLCLLAAPLYANGAVVITPGPAGLSSLSYNGTPYLASGQACSAVAVAFSRGSARVPAPLGSAQSAIHHDGGIDISRTYQWGSLGCSYSAEGDRVRVEVSINNRTGNTIDKVRLQLIDLTPPAGKVTGANGSDSNIGGPNYRTLPYPSAKLYITNEQVAQPLWIMPVSYPNSLNIFLDSDVVRPKPLESPLKRPIPPGHSDHYSLSLRFANPNEPVTTVMSDLFRKWTARFPNKENWPDRRPIGYIALAGHGPNTPYNPHNPRYWYLADPKLDINSNQGRQAFRTRLLELADKAVANLKRINAQGMIVWDVEGEQYLQPSISYIGDPRHLPPEMQDVAGDFFRKFTSAGLRCGVTLRPQALVVPGNGDFVTNRPYRINSQDPKVMFQQLDEKIEYTQHRFGCTLFYVDSNGTTGWPFDWRAFAWLHDKHPDVLVVPEHKTLLYYTVTAPYCDVTLISYDCPSLEARWLYPHAFSVINLDNGNAEAEQASGDLAARVAAGDVMMAQVTFNDPHLKTVEVVRQRALSSRQYPPR